jgi:hypothetical protein
MPTFPARSRFVRFISASTLALIGASGSASALPTPIGSQSAAEVTAIPNPNSGVRDVEIDGRFYTVAVQINRAIGGALGPDGPFISTSVAVQISVNDGALLPDDLRVAGVRFETTRGIRRVFFTPVERIEAFPFDDATDEVDQDDYVGDLSARRAVKFLRTTVRIEVGDRVFRIPFGVQPVVITPLP